MKKTIINIIKKSPFSFIYNYLKRKKLLSQDPSIPEKFLEFYSVFVRSNSVVFDVGANYGNRSKVFRKLGARVVAFEPQKKCYDYLASYFWGDSKMKIEKCALGEKNYETSMLISNHSVLSTLSKEFVEKTQASGRFTDRTWADSQAVKVKTLDEFILKHGPPCFIKIDVEGFEHEVIKGLNHPIPAISLEYARENLGNLLGALKKISKLGDYKYQFSPQESLILSNHNWKNFVQISEELENYSGLEWGDVYCVLKNEEFNFDTQKIC
jgi:FkbM family methyltransferase